MTRTSIFELTADGDFSVIRIVPKRQSATFQLFDHDSAWVLPGKKTRGHAAYSSFMKGSFFLDGPRLIQLALLFLRIAGHPKLAVLCAQWLNDRKVFRFKEEEE